MEYEIIWGKLDRLIAEYLGWVAVQTTEGLWHLANNRTESVRGFGTGLDSEHCWRVNCPKYSETLDACVEIDDYICHENGDTRKAYETALVNIVNINEGLDYQVTIEHVKNMIYATSQQKSQAFAVAVKMPLDLWTQKK